MNDASGISEDNLKMFDQYVDANYDRIFNTLNFRVGMGELTSSIRKLKSGKASSEDLILTEMLKSREAKEARYTSFFCTFLTAF